MELTDGMRIKQVRFCQEYVIDYNGSAAAVRAGYNANSSKEQASALLTKDNVKAYVNHLASEQAAIASLTKERVIKELIDLTTYDASKIYDDNGCPLKISKIDKATRKAITGVKTIETKSGEKVTEYKLADKIQAINMLIKHTNLLAPERLDISTDQELTINIIDAVKNN